MFNSFKHHHPRQYSTSSTEAIHYQIFQERLISAIKNNIETKESFTVGLNKFSDWTPPELEILRGNRPPTSRMLSNSVTMTVSQIGSSTSAKKKNQKTSSLPTPTFDYTTRVSALNSSVSIIRPVRDQGRCGSCYAFAIITLVEAQYAFHYGQAVNMSDQQIVDCSTDDYGCIGGYFDTSFAYIKSNGWYMNSASSYPYIGIASSCSAKKTDGWLVGDLVYRHLPSKNTTAMQKALVNYGPLWISLYVGSDCSGSAQSSCPVNPSTAHKIMSTFQSYTGGIFQIDGCITTTDHNNHAMVVVGYGHDSATNLDYWKLRNSWGNDWGEDGYIRIRRGINMCNVESDAFFIAKPAP